MISKNTKILLGVFAVLLLGTLFYQRTQQGREGDAGEDLGFPTSPPAVRLFEFTVEDIRSLTISDPEGNLVRIAQTDGVWTMVIPPTQLDEAQTFQLQSAASQLANWQTLAPLDPISDLEAVGLFNPAYRITVELVSGEEVRVDIGNVTATGSGYYVRVSGGLPQLVNKAAVDNVLNLLLNPPVPPTATGAPTAEGTVEATSEATLEGSNLASTGEATAEATQEGTPEATATP